MTFSNFNKNEKSILGFFKKKFTLILCVAIVALILIIFGIKYYFWFNDALRDIYLKNFDKERYNAFLDLNKSLFTIGGGVLASIGLMLAYIRSKASQKSADAATKASEVASLTQLSESFSRALEQLASDKIEIRLGGIYTLDHIAEISEKYQPTVLEILCSFIREHCKKSEVRSEQESQNIVNPKTDIQSIITIIGEKKYYLDKNINLKNTNLIDYSFFNLKFQKANFSGSLLDYAQFPYTNLKEAIFTTAHLQGAHFIEAHLQGAHFESAHLEEADLEKAHLEGAYLGRARLEGAHFEEAHLEEADLEYGLLQEAHLRGAHLERARLGGAHIEGARLEMACLEGAQLQKVHFERANLESANLEGANLERANLEDVYGITEIQLSKVYTLYEADLDPEMEKNLKSKHPHLFEKPKK